MKKTFNSAKIEVVKLSMPNIIATSTLDNCGANSCYDKSAKENIWDED